MAIDPVAIVSGGTFSDSWASTDIPDSLVTRGLLLKLPLPSGQITAKGILWFMQYQQLRRQL